MKPVLRLSRGASPWRPSNDVVVGEVLVQVTYPTTGLLHDGGHNYLFTEIAHVEDVENVWAFVEISSSEMWTLIQTAGPDAFHDLRLTYLSGRSVSFAFAPDHRISASKTLYVDSRGIAAAASRFFHRTVSKGGDRRHHLAAHG